MQARAALAQADMTVSMSRTGNWCENAVPESFVGTLKGEGVDRACFQTRQGRGKLSREDVECFYNRLERHSSLGYLSPLA
jgi:putative transposase